jgi:hypothetical protein
MIEQSSASLCWREGANYLSPVQRILAFGYYDGPTDGVLLCGNAQDFRLWQGKHGSNWLPFVANTRHHVGPCGYSGEKNCGSQSMPFFGKREM